LHLKNIAHGMLYISFIIIIRNLNPNHLSFLKGLKKI
jgi:hypothetical protein